ncbi:unnamed protein product [Choristocarpus tenellus]
MSSFVAAVLGASGNVGGGVIKALLAEHRCGKLLLVGRRTLPFYKDEPRIHQHVVNMDNLEAESTSLLRDAGVQACFITMGVGAPVQDGVSREYMEKVEVNLPTSFARGAKDSGCVRHVALLSSIGANMDAKLPEWTGIVGAGPYFKGLVENNMQEMEFESVGIFRPATLIGNTNTPRWAAAVSKSLSWMLPIKYKEIHIDRLGEAMVKAAVSSLDAKGPTVAIYEGNSLFEQLK